MYEKGAQPIVPTACVYLLDWDELFVQVRIENYYGNANGTELFVLSRHASYETHAMRVGSGVLRHLGWFGLGL
jgi:hypothetical protein